jgi:N-acyl-D-aspartate/D-glutamate deacylase
MYDKIIRGGRVVDGTGAAPRNADIAIQDGRIAEIGKVAAAARDEIDADGALVTPGFIDLHTHYDGQFLWDDQIDPSFSHGVTTAIAGNCGVGFAPLAHEHRRELMEMMEGVEDIPGIVLDEGLDWGWTSFADYMNRLGARRYAMDVASHITHAPLRVFVMGERAIRHEEATAEDIAAMAGHVRDAMASGAVGFSAGRLVEHLSSRGANVPGTFAGDDELTAIARAMGESGRGVFQLIPKGAIGAAMGNGEIGAAGRLEEYRRLEAIARACGRPLTYSIAEFLSDPADILRMVELSDASCAAGLEIRPQVAARGVGMLHMLDSYHVFLMRPSYRKIAHLPRAARAAAMRDPELRRAILSEPNVEGEYADDPNVMPMLRRLAANLPKSFVLATALDYEPGPERRVGALAEAAGKTPEEYIYDHYAAGEGANFSVTLALNYVGGDLHHVRDMLQNPNVVSGLGDGGAHMKVICDASMPTFQMAFWTRERTRGERLPIELVVRKISRDPARLYGMTDRGELAVGQRADINVIDYERLNIKAPHIANDLPSGAGRLLQGSEGYLATLVAGEVTRRHDADTGARPGRLVRMGQTV